MRPCRIQVNVVCNRSEVFALINRQRLVSSLKQMSPDFVPGIEPLRIGALEPAHTIYEIRFRCLQEKMVMIAHQDKGVNQPAVSFGNLLKGVEESLMILFILINFFLTISTAHHVIRRTLKFNARFSSHVVQLNRVGVGFQSKITN